MTPRYSVRVDRIGTADYAAYVFREIACAETGKLVSRCIADVRSYLPALAVRDAVESVRYLRRGGWLDAEPARVAGGAL